MCIPWSRPGRELKYVEAKAGCVYGNVKQKYGTWTLISAEPDAGNWVTVTQVCEKILFQNFMFLYWNLSCQTRQKLFSFLLFFNLEEVETNVSRLRFISF